MKAYTKNRKVEVVDEKGASFSPKLMLGPMTEVEIDLNEKAKNVGGPLWVPIRLTADSLKGKTGWVPLAALSDHAVNVVRFSTKHGTTGITGNGYGAEEYLWSGGRVLYVDGDDGGILPWRAYCEQCGNDSASHRLAETKMTMDLKWEKPPSPKNKSEVSASLGNFQAPRGMGTADDAAKLYAAVLEALKNPKEGGKTESLNSYLKIVQYKIMIGVLHVAESDVVYASHSGVSDNEEFRGICKNLGFVYCSKPNPKTNLKTRGCHAVTKITHKELSTCAAPKLIVKAINDGQYPCAMTEVWVDVNNLHAQYPAAHTIESCDDCRTTIPYLLCPWEWGPPPEGRNNNGSSLGKQEDKIV